MNLSCKAPQVDSKNGSDRRTMEISKWKSKTKLLADFLFIDGYLFAVLTQGKGSEDSIFIKGTNPTPEGSVLMSSSPLKSPTSKFLYTGDEVSTNEFGGDIV